MELHDKAPLVYEAMEPWRRYLEPPPVLAQIASAHSSVRDVRSQAPVIYGSAKTAVVIEAYEVLYFDPPDLPGWIYDGEYFALLPLEVEFP